MSHRAHQQCIQACLDCMQECEHCATACLSESDPKMMVRCIQLDRTCAEICALAAKEMSRGSEFAERVCRLCAEVCEACGNECRQHDVAHCQTCAEACARCAEACRGMSGSVAHT